MTLRHRFWRWAAIHLIPWLIETWCPCHACFVIRAGASPHAKEIIEQSQRAMLEEARTEGTH